MQISCLCIVNLGQKVHVLGKDALTKVYAAILEDASELFAAAAAAAAVIVEEQLAEVE